jgi:hypothetical protein
MQQQRRIRIGIVRRRRLAALPRIRSRGRSLGARMDVSRAPTILPLVVDQMHTRTSGSLQSARHHESNGDKGGHQETVL